MLIRFADLVGHASAIASVQRALAAQRVHHAMLIAGPDGVGKERLTQAIRNVLLCHAPVAADACGSCPSCRQIAAGTHPDTLDVVADGRFIKIDQVRAATALTRFRPYAGPRRVIRILEADLLKEEAANALLKTLEEPGGETIFLLTTAQAHRLLTTVRSRCQPLRVGRLQPEEVLEVLQRIVPAAAGLAEASRLCGGSPGRAVEMLQSAVFGGRLAMLERVALLQEEPVDAAVRLAEELATAKDDLPAVLALVRGFLRDALVASSGADLARLQDPLTRQLAMGWGRRRGAPGVLTLLDTLEQVEGWLRGNVNPRLCAETLMLALAGYDATGTRPS